MKKEYISPSTSVILLDCTGMLCASDSPTTPETPKFDTSDTETLPVKKDVWDGDVL